MFDQRGTGQTDPRPVLPAVGDRHAADWPSRRHCAGRAAAQLDLAIQLYTACGQAYQEAGVDLTKYNSAENAADIEDLRLALGYEQINLIGALVRHQPGA